MTLKEEPFPPSLPHQTATAKAKIKRISKLMLITKKIKLCSIMERVNHKKINVDHY